MVVTRASVDPDALGDGGADGDGVIAVERVDDDGLEIAFGWQEVRSARPDHRIGVW